MLVAALPPTFPPSCRSEVEIGESPDDWGIHNTIVASCVFSRCAQTTPLSEQQEVLFPSNFGTLVLPPQRGGGGLSIRSAFAHNAAEANCVSPHCPHAEPFQTQLIPHYVSDPLPQSFVGSS